MSAPLEGFLALPRSAASNLNAETPMTNQRTRYVALALCSLALACESQTTTEIPLAADVVVAVAPTCRGLVATIYPGAPSLPVGASITPIGGGVQIEGTSGDDVIVASGGNDRVYGRAGNDVICVLNGNDYVNAGLGDDAVEGSGGNDFIDGDPGNDDLEGGAGNDSILGAAGDDVMRGGTGTDSIVGGPDADSANGGLGSDTCDAETETNCEG
jgi:hypothetical protein